MNYELTLPPEVESRLSMHAMQTGQDVLHLIQLAVTRFVEPSTEYAELRFGTIGDGNLRNS